MTIDRSMMMIDDGGSFAGTFEQRTRQEAIANVNAIRDELRDKGKTPKQIQNNKRYQQAKAELDSLVKQANIQPAGTTPTSPGGGKVPGGDTQPGGGGRLYTATDGRTFENFEEYKYYQDRLDSQEAGKAREELLKRERELELQERQQTARATLEALLRQFFFGSDASFVQNALNAAEGDIKLGLPTDVIILKMQNYDDPNSLFARRFSGNVKLRKEGIEPLSPAEYLEQESRYREVLSTRGLGELASRSTFADLIGNQVSPFELEDRVTKVFDVYDSADTALKSELQTTLRLDPVATRTSVAKALLLGDKGATELQRQVRTAEVGVEARTRGLDVTAASELAGMGVTREQARAGFEQIALTQPRLTQLSEFYTGATPDATGLQQELEREQFQGMQSQRRRRLAGQEQASFMGQSGTAGSQSLARRRAGSI